MQVTIEFYDETELQIVQDAAAKLIRYRDEKYAKNNETAAPATAAPATETTPEPTPRVGCAPDCGPFERTPAIEAATNAEAKALTPEPAAAPAAQPTEAEVVEAVRTLATGKGIAEAVKLLGEFGAKRAGDVPAERRADFIALAQRAVSA